MNEHQPTSTEAANNLLNRRSALIGAGGLAGSLALATATPSWARKTRIAPVNRPAQRLRMVDRLPDPNRQMGEALYPEIKNLVLVMMENHSTDNVLGMLGKYSPKHRHTFDGLPLNKKGKPVAHNPNKKGKRVYSYPLPDMCPFQGLSQDWNNSHLQWDHGRNDGFVITTDSIVPMSYLTREQMPISYAIAENYAVSDRNFCSLMGQTLPNRRYYFSGTSSGYCNDTDASVLVTPPGGTIFDRMNTGNVSWALYTDGTPTPDYFLPTFATKEQLHCGDLVEFHELAAQGKLLTVTYVEANGNWESEENPQDIAYGENFLANVVNAVQSSPQWPHIALFVTYDEHGGYFDHVPPAPAVEPDDIQPILGSSTGATYKAAFNRTGFRVPHTIVSPWAKPGYVSHKITDHTSALAFIETQWNLPPMTKRDAAAWDYTDQFDFSAPSHETPVKMPSPPSIDGTLAQCRKDGENPPTPQNDGGPDF
jgi:phospholipase C